MGGLNFAGTAVSPAPPYDLSVGNGANLGGFVEYDMTPSLSLEVRGLYVQKRIQADGPNGAFRGAIAADYVNFPVLLKAKMNRFAWRPYLAVGGDLGFKTSARAVVRMDDWEREDEDFDDGVRSTDFGLNFGGGIEIPRDPISFRIEGLYSLGLANLVAVPDDEPESVKTRTFLVNIAIGF
jgi:hypothetical protein